MTLQATEVVLQLLNQDRGKAQFVDKTYFDQEATDANRAPVYRVDIPVQVWRDMGMPVEATVVIVPGSMVGKFKDPADLFTQATLPEEIISGSFDRS